MTGAQRTVTIPNSRLEAVTLRRMVTRCCRPRGRPELKYRPAAPVQCTGSFRNARPIGFLESHLGLWQFRGSRARGFVLEGFYP